MSEYIICELSEEEEKILVENDVDFLIDDPFSMSNRDINVNCSRSRFEEILKMIGRKSSYPNGWVPSKEVT